jgi:hypothetical protein
LRSQPFSQSAQPRPRIAAAFLPKDGWLARLISGTRSVPEPALKDMLEAYDAAKKKAEQITP